MKQITLKVEYLPEDIVYLKTDIEQTPRMVTGYFIRPKGIISYYLSCGTNETSHYGIEISAEKDIMISTSN